VNLVFSVIYGIEVAINLSIYQKEFFVIPSNILDTIFLGAYIYDCTHANIGLTILRSFRLLLVLEHFGMMFRGYQGMFLKMCMVLLQFLFVFSLYGYLMFQSKVTNAAIFKVPRLNFNSFS
jgi:hypothetical protein